MILAQIVDINSTNTLSMPLRLRYQDLIDINKKLKFLYCYLSQLLSVTLLFNLKFKIILTL